MDRFESLEDIQLDVYNDGNSSLPGEFRGVNDIFASMDNPEYSEERDSVDDARDNKLFVEVLGVTNLQPTGSHSSCFCRISSLMTEILG